MTNIPVRKIKNKKKIEMKIQRPHLSNCFTYLMHELELQGLGHE